jgi:hypothetical protein
MGAGPSVERVTYEEVQRAQRDRAALVVSTLLASEQGCLVLGTLAPAMEEQRLNACLKQGEARRSVVVYGRNALDPAPEKKCRQLMGLGFTNVRLYAGGLFEWALLQDIYGTDMFGTTSPCADPLRFKDGETGPLRLTG